MAPSSPSQRPRVRFAPSPTGYLHVGGGRTALFNWLFARRQGGIFILRVEDTDVDRNRPELVEGILNSLRWLGLDWDEGPVHQSQRLDLYPLAAEKLLAAGDAYFCFCSAERYAGGDAASETADIPAEAAAAAKELRVTRCACRGFSGSDRVRKQEEGISPAIRFRVPESGATRFDDAVFGPRELQNQEIDDFVLLRSSRLPGGPRLPTYHLACVVDDIEMRITHVIRGADHLSNTPKQVLIYNALGAAPPVFAHVPLILGPDRTRLSKRHGATSVGSYQDEGFLPEAFRNFLALLGWSAGGDAEFLRTPDLISRFSLSGVSRTNAVFDRAKLEWFNTDYLQNLPVDDLLPAVEAQLRSVGLWQERWASTDRAWFARTVDLIRPRTRLLPDFSTWARAFFSDDFAYDSAAREKFWKLKPKPGEPAPHLAALLSKLADSYAALSAWDHDACDKVLRDLAAAENLKAGVLINAVRVAITGQAVAPPLFDTMVVLGQMRVVHRLRQALPAVRQIG